MSKYLAAFYNNTNEKILFVNYEDRNNDQTVAPGSMFTTKPLFNIPDNSNSAEYFSDHHMEVQNAANNQVIFSFWDADVRDISLKGAAKDVKQGSVSLEGLKKDFTICYCQAIDWMSTQKKMPGFNPSGNNIKVAIVLSGSNPNYEIKSYAVNALV